MDETSHPDDEQDPGQRPQSGDTAAWPTAPGASPTPPSGYPAPGGYPTGPPAGGYGPPPAPYGQPTAGGAYGQPAPSGPAPSGYGGAAAGGYGPPPAPGGWGGSWNPPPAPAGPPPAAWGSSTPGHDPYWTPQPPRRATVSIAVTALLVLVAVLAGVGIGRSLPSPTTTPAAAGGSNNGATTPSGGGSTPPTSGGSTTPGGGSSGPADVSAIATKVDPDLVDIDTDLSYQDEEAAGTGIVLNADGLVLTNNHVIDGATVIKVTDIGNGKSYPGTVLGYDETKDVALVQLQGASGLRTATLATSFKTSVGQAVVALGNAGGKGGTPTPAGGTITALDQSITATDEGDGSSEQLAGLIQTDADVQPGDSGGSLVNAAGQVIGMDTAASQSFSFSTSGSEGFAIPIATALGLVHEIETHATSATLHIGPTAFIGVTAAPQSCSADGVGPSIANGAGALVCKVVSGTAAQKAGLVANDVITSLGGSAVSSPANLTKLLVPDHPGDQVSLGWTTSAGAHMTATVALGSGPPG